MAFHHSKSTNIHRLQAFTYANASARLAATGFTSADIGKRAYQQSDKTFWDVKDVISGVPVWTGTGLSELDILDLIRSNIYSPVVFLGFNQDIPYIAGTNLVPNFVTTVDGDVYVMREG